MVQLLCFQMRVAAADPLGIQQSAGLWPPPAGTTVLPVAPSSRSVKSISVAAFRMQQKIIIIFGLIIV